jgi:hypothetical protein
MDDPWTGRGKYVEGFGDFMIFFFPIGFCLFAIRAFI